MRKSYDANDYEQSGTTLSAEVVGPDGECQIMEIHTNRWEITGDEMGELLRRLLGAMGFAESTINEIFGDDNDAYGVMAGDLAGRAPNSDEDQLDTFCPDSIPFVPYREVVRNHNDEVATTFDAKTVRVPEMEPADDPCCECSTYCLDTACVDDQRTVR